MKYTQLCSCVDGLCRRSCDTLEFFALDTSLWSQQE